MEIKIKIERGWAVSVSSLCLGRGKQVKRESLMCCELSWEVGNE